MSRRMTPLLLAVALAVGLVTYLSEAPSSSVNNAAPAGGARVLQMTPADIVQVRVKLDYWNSYCLRRGPDGLWRLAEPSSEPAAVATVNRLLDTLVNLPVITTIDLPGDDSERYREYGLWDPTMEITVTTGHDDHSLLFGSQTPDGKATYCAAAGGRDHVYVVAAEAVRAIPAEASAFREGPEPTNVESSDGLQIEELAAGSGPIAQTGQSVNVNYTGRLQDGTVFDSSSRHGRPFTFTIGARQVIQGWDQGVAGMRVGGKRRLTIPPGLGYGVLGQPPTIPPNATLIFEIELLSIN